MSKNKLVIEQLLLCDMTLFSRENKLSLIGIFDQMFFPKLPASHSKICIVGFVKGQPDTSEELILSVKDPNNQSVLPPQPVKVTVGPYGTSYLLYELLNFPVVSPGNYIFSVSHGSSILASCRLVIQQTGVSN